MPALLFHHSEVFLRLMLSMLSEEIIVLGSSPVGAHCLRICLDFHTKRSLEAPKLAKHRRWGWHVPSLPDV